MRINDILIENKQITEAPLGMLSKLGHGVKSAFGSSKSKGVLATGNASNQLKKDYMAMLGSTGQEAESDNLIAFLQKAGYPVDRVKQTLGKAQAEPIEPTMDPENPPAAGTAQPTPAANRPQGGGKVSGQQSQTPNAIRQRDSRRDATNAKATTGGAGAFNQMTTQLTKPNDTVAKGTGKVKGVQPTDIDQTNANLQTKIAANKAGTTQDGKAPWDPATGKGAKFDGVTGKATPAWQAELDKQDAAATAKSNSLPQLGAVPTEKEKVVKPNSVGQAAKDAEANGQDPEAAAKAAMAAKNPNLAALMAKQDAEDNDPARTKSKALGPKGRETLARLGKQSQVRTSGKQGTLDLNSRKNTGNNILEALSDKQIDAAFLMAVQDKARAGGSVSGKSISSPAPADSGDSGSEPSALGTLARSAMGLRSRSSTSGGDSTDNSSPLDGIDLAALKVGLTNVVNDRPVDNSAKREFQKLVKKL